MRSHDRIMAAVDNKPNEAGTKTREAGPILHLTQFNHFLRAIGLELLSLLQIKTKKGRGEGEPAKPVIQTSLSTALTRCCVHILPILVSITIVSLNLGHIFLGSTIPGIILDNSIAIAIFQVLAKLQELLIIASLATLVFEVVRDLMIFGDGVPLGFLGSGFMFSDISYFWSPEFWGAFGACVSFRQKFYFTTLLLASGLIAATAGPSCAVLLIPRQQGWVAGSSDFYLRGLAEDLYPSVMSASTEPESFCANAEGTNYAVCPSGGFYSLWSYSSFLPTIRNSVNLQPKPLSVYGLWATQNVNMASTMSVVPNIQLFGAIRGVACQTSASGPFLPVAMYQTQLHEDWYTLVGNIRWTAKISETSASEYKWNTGDNSDTATQVPAVRVACSEGQNISAGLQTVNFPVLPEYSCWKGAELPEGLQVNSTATDQIRATWVPLSSDFGAVSTGLVIEAPWTQDKASRVVVGCSIDARWTKGSVDGGMGMLDDQAGPGLWGGPLSETTTGFRPYANSSWTRIDLDESWLQILTPPSTMKSTGNSTRNLTTLESILANSAIIDTTLINSVDQTVTWNDMQIGGSNRTVYLEWIVSLLVTDGLARQGSSKALNTSGPVPEWSLLDYVPRPDFNKSLLGSGQALERPPTLNITTFNWRLTIQGLSYKASLSTDYLSISVLLGHIVLAMAHTLWLLYKRQSSGCWDTITELVTLAQNSRPAHAVLKNTSTGIKCIGTFAKVTKVRVVRGSDLNEEHPTRPPTHVELVFSEGREPPEETRWLISENETAHVSSVATWPSVRNDVAASGLDIGIESLHSASSSQVFLLQPLKGNGNKSNNSVHITHQEAAMDDLEMVYPDQLYG
jgi:hypothetical protein